MEMETIALERNSADDDCVVVAMLGFIILSPEGLLIFSPAKKHSQIGCLFYSNTGFVVSHVIIL